MRSTSERDAKAPVISAGPVISPLMIILNGNASKDLKETNFAPYTASNWLAKVIRVDAHVRNAVGAQRFQQTRCIAERRTRATMAATVERAIGLHGSGRAGVGLALAA